MRLAYRLRASQLASLLLLGSSCSVLYDLSPDQCERNSDCASFGAGYICEAGLCKSTDHSSGGASSSTGGSESESGGRGGSGGKGGGGGTSGSGGKAANGGSAGDLGGGGAGDAGGVGGDGGSGGVTPPECIETAECDALYGVSDPHTCVDGKCEPIPPECATHAECLAKNNESEPVACVRGQCKPLLTEQCPVALPDLKGTSDDIYGVLKSSNAVILGAFTFIAPDSLRGIGLNNFDLVLRDFYSKVNGVVLDKARRNVVIVACSSNGFDSTQLLNAGRHLAYDLDVSAILSALPASDTQTLFETFRTERNKNVFFLMPNYTDETLINLEDDNLIWHMLSGADSLSATYTPLLQRAETHLRNAGTIGAAEDMRVALITASDERFLNDLGGSVGKNIRFNGGKSAAENAPASFVEKETTSYYSDTAHTVDRAAEIGGVLALAPHVVIGATGEEMLDDIIPAIEDRWVAAVGTAQPKPFYLVSPFAYNSSFLAPLFSKYPTVRTRFAGVNWAAAEDRTLYNAYMDRYQAMFSVRNEGYENWYDAAYYLVYALAGGHSPDATAIAGGFKRLLAGTSYNVGQDDMTPILNVLGKQTGDVRLIGAGGPPNWNTTTGGRNDGGSVWCMKADGTLMSDALRYQPPPPSGGDGSLTGTAFCFTFPKPAP